MKIEEAKERLKSIVDFYKLNDENNYDYSDDVLISMKLVLEEIERLNNIRNKAIEYIDKNKQKTIAAYGDNYDDDFEICLWEEDIDNLLNILKGGK